MYNKLFLHLLLLEVNGRNNVKQNLQVQILLHSDFKQVKYGNAQYSNKIAIGLKKACKIWGLNEWNAYSSTTETDGSQV